MECPACEAAIAADSNFCPFCGLPILLRRERAEADEPPPVDLDVDADVDTSELVVTEEGDPVLAQTRPVRASDTSGAPAPSAAGQDAAAALVVCAACGARNGPLRGACARCGRGLAHDTDATVGVGGRLDDTTHAPPTTRSPRASGPVRAASPSTPDRERPARDDSSRDRRSPAMTVFLVGAFVGTVVGLIVWFVFGRSDGTPSSARFDPGVYVTQPAGLDVAEVAATSVRAPGDEGSHGPDLVVDGDAATAWIEGAERGSGRGEALTLRFTAAAWANSVTVRNGWQRDADRWATTARARRLRATFDDGTEYVIVLADTQGAQRARLPDPVLTRTVELEVLDVYGGDVSDELALSEVRFGGWRARGADRRAPHLRGSS